MVTTDPIADMLTRIRNANDAYHDKVDMPASKMKAAVLAILKDEGFVKSVEQIEVEGHPELRVALKYGANREYPRRNEIRSQIPQFVFAQYDDYQFANNIKRRFMEEIYEKSKLTGCGKPLMSRQAKILSKNHIV